MAKGYAIRGSKGKRMAVGAIAEFVGALFDARSRRENWESAAHSAIAPGVAGAWAQSHHRIRTRREAMETGRAVARMATPAVKKIVQAAAPPAQHPSDD